MKIKLTLSLLLIFNFGFAFSQTAGDTISSAKPKPPYRSNIESLLDLSVREYSHDPGRSLQYAGTAVEIARKNNDKFTEAMALRVIGDTYRKLDYERLALPYYTRALELAASEKMVSLQAELNILIGEVYYELNRIDTARIFYFKGLYIYQKNNDKTGIANSMLKLGNTSWYISNYDKALDYYLDALSIFEQTNNVLGVAKIYKNIGTLYTALGDNDKALSFLSKSLGLYRNLKDAENLSELYYRLGVVYEHQKNFHRAAFYFDKAKVIFDSLHIDRKSAYVDRSKGRIAFYRGNVDKAIELAKKAVATFERFEYKWGIVEAKNDLGTYYIRKRDFANASVHLLFALDVALELKSLELLKDTYLHLSELYGAQSDYKNSLRYYKLFQTINDSLITREKNARIAELQAKYDTDKKEQEIQQKNEQIIQNLALIDRQKIHIYLFVAGIGLILFLAIVLYRQYRKVEVKWKRIERINTELDQRVKERTTALRLTQFSVEHAADPIFWIDPVGRFLFANNAACITLNYSRDELLGLKITDIVPKFTYNDWVDFWEITRKEGSLVVETKFRRKDLSEISIEIIMNYIIHDDKEHAFAFVRDISDRKLKEENLQRAKEKAEEADKLKSAFLANMSHEIRTPMNAIIGFSDMLINEEFTSDERKEFIDIIKTSGDTLLKLIDDIIDISLIEAGQLKTRVATYNLNTLVVEIHRFFQGEKDRQNKPQIDIRLADAGFDETIVIETDQIRFRQILTNLIGNALKFTEKGYIEVGYEIVDAHHLTVFVKDTGIGIPPDKINMVFERFSKLDDEQKLYRGTGLGLTISKKLVQQMGGELTVESVFGEGSTFRFTIPYHNGVKVKVEDVCPKLIENELYNWHKKTLLVVEDVESNYLLIEKALKKTGAKLLWAKNGREALAFCESVRPNVVLMDIQLPGKSGYEITREILEIYPQVPIIAQTAYAFNNEKEKILEAGCIAYITKPIKSVVLYEVINKYIS